jgi:hypothetical protein
MKKSFKNFILMTLAVGIIGTAFIQLMEYMFGIVAVFTVATGICAIAGIVYVPYMQIVQYRRRRRVEKTQTNGWKQITSYMNT